IAGRRACQRTGHRNVRAWRTSGDRSEPPRAGRRDADRVPRQRTRLVAGRWSTPRDRGVRASSTVSDSAVIRLGLGPNLGQFALLVAVNALVGGMVGQERTVLPLLATDVFGLQALSSALTFIVAFGLTKALANFAAGALSDRVGRKPVLVSGWLVGLPVPLLLIWAPAWEWVIVANVLLGINQGLT